MINVYLFQTIRDKLRANPVVRVAFENHQRQKEQEEEERMAASPSLIISRMSRKKPLTKTDMMVGRKYTYTY